VTYQNIQRHEASRGLCDSWAFCWQSSEFSSCASSCQNEGDCL